MLIGGIQMNRKIFIVLLLLTLSCQLAAKDSNNAVVKFVIGTVEIQSKNKVSWHRLMLNEEVKEGDKIKTALNARAEIRMPDGSDIKINENTTFEVKELKTPETDKADKMSFTLWAGKFWGSFKKIITGRQERTIDSPSAVVAIRGTTIEMEVDLQQSTTVRVLEGEVSVRSKDVDGEVTVSSNQQTIIEKGKAPSDPNQYNPEETGTQGAFPFQINLTQFVFTDPSVLGGGIPVSGELPPGTDLFVDGIPVPVLPNGKFNANLRVVEGVNKKTIEARKNNTKKSKDVTLFVNTKKPEIRLSTPLVAGFYNRRDYSLSGGVFDPTPGDKVKVFINNEEIIEVAGQGSFNRTVILQEGQNTIAVMAKDRSDNTKEIVQNLFLDTVKPILTITEPAQQVYNRMEPPRHPNGEVNQFEQTIRGIVIDPEPSSGIKRISINGKDIKPNSDGTFETTIELSRGINSLNFVVEDLAGNIYRDNTRKIRII